MTKETQGHVFEPFFTTKGTGKGNGLGLATVYGIVQQSNGYVSVKSELGHGTTFELLFPLVRDASDGSSEEVSACIPAGKETIMVVEDSQEVRELVRQFLEVSGYEVLTAENAEAALRVATEYKRPIHLVLSDIVMPHISGPELIDRLTSKRPTIKVLYMSGYTDASITKDRLRQEDINFVQKPFTQLALARKVREVLDGTAKQAARGKHRRAIR